MALSVHQQDGSECSSTVTERPSQASPAQAPSSCIQEAQPTGVLSALEAWSAQNGIKPYSIQEIKDRFEKQRLAKLKVHSVRSESREIR